MIIKIGINSNRSIKLTVLHIDSYEIELIYAFFSMIVAYMVNCFYILFA